MATDSENSQAAADALAAAITGPKKVASDAGSVEQHPLADLIEADRYQASKAAAANPSRGLRISRMIPPGTV
jgi:hypothetical protein